MSKQVKSNSIRLIAGNWRGTRLPVLDHDGLRPTTNRVRETLFNWLMHDTHSATVLDLFAGTGALGMECLSRGASFVQFVENEPKVAAFLNKNLSRLSVDSDLTDVSISTANRYLAKQVERRFDLVFLDPPFQSELLQPAIEQLEAGNWLVEQAVIYIEYASGSEQPEIPSSWQLSKNGKAGQSAYALYRRSA